MPDTPKVGGRETEEQSAFVRHDFGGPRFMLFRNPRPIRAEVLMKQSYTNSRRVFDPHPDP
jgi:hypothetical protein